MPCNALLKVQTSDPRITSLMLSRANWADLEYKVQDDDTGDFYNITDWFFNV